MDRVPRFTQDRGNPKIHALDKIWSRVVRVLCGHWSPPAWLLTKRRPNRFEPVSTKDTEDLAMNQHKVAFTTVSLLGGLFVASSVAFAGDGCDTNKKKGYGTSSYRPAVYQPARMASNAGYQGTGGFIKTGMHGDSHGADAPTGDVVDVAVGAGSFNTLVAAVKAAGLVDTLKGDGPFTVFAPTDDAFAKIPADQLNALLADKDALIKVLTYHVIPGKVMAADVAKLDSAKTVEGSSITIDTTDGVKVDEATVVKTDIVASNGVIHVIDTVIMPN